MATFASGIVYDNTGGGYEGVVILFLAVSAAALLAAFGVRVGTKHSPASPGSEDGEELRRLVKGNPNLNFLLLHDCIADMV